MGYLGFCIVAFQKPYILYPLKALQLKYWGLLSGMFVPTFHVCHFSRAGYQAAKPDMICKLEKGEEPCLGKGKKPRQGGPNETARPKQTEANGSKF